MNLHKVARKLRQDMTEAEKAVWLIIKTNFPKYKFRRQHPVDDYIVDFICIQKSLIIEVDGGQHTEEKDKARTEQLQKRGYRILRLWNNESLKNKEGVYQRIAEELNCDN
jgi:very-short-patch-repair endonuclease